MPTRKTHFSLPKPPNVTVEPYTPSVPPPSPPKAEPALPQSGAGLPAGLQPTDFSGLGEQPLPAYAAPTPPPPAPPDPLERVAPDSLLKRLEQRFSVQRTFTKTLKSTLGDLTVVCRLRNFDDYLWAIDEIVREQAEPTAAAFGENARSALAKHASACRCVLKIEGEWVWDVFQLRADIQAVQPQWTGETHVGLPEFYVNVLARNVFDLFRHKLHSDLLFDLNSVLEEEEAQRPDPPKAT